MLYWPDHLSMFRNYVPIRIDMQVLSNRRTKMNTAFAALSVWMFTLASWPMQTLGKHGVTVN